MSLEPHDQVTNLLCPHCRKVAAPNIQKPSVPLNPAGQPVGVSTSDGRWMVAQFPCCRRFALLFGREEGVVLSCFPPPSPLTVPDHVPPHIARDFQEASSALGADLAWACTLMARRTIEALCEDKGATGRNLVARIDALHTSGIVTRDLAEAAHQVRMLGNDGAHEVGAATPRPTHDDLLEVLELARMLLTSVYTVPETTRRATARRAGAAKAAGT